MVILEVVVKVVVEVVMEVVMEVVVVAAAGVQCRRRGGGRRAERQRQARARPCRRRSSLVARRVSIPPGLAPALPPTPGLAEKRVCAASG